MSERTFVTGAALLEHARELQLQGYSEDKYASLDFDDARYLARLNARSLKGRMTLADLDGVIEAIEAEEIAEIRRRSEIYSGCNERRDDLRVFTVINTANRRLKILAKDAKCARLFARWHGHIKEEANGEVRVLKPEYESKLRKSGEALGRALRDGYPGVVKEVGQNVVIEGKGKVYTPMTVVE